MPAELVATGFEVNDSAEELFAALMPQLGRLRHMPLYLVSRWWSFQARSGLQVGSAMQCSGMMSMTALPGHNGTW